MSDPNSDNNGSSPTTAQKTLYTYWGIAATAVAAYGAGLAVGIACTVTAVVCAVAVLTLVASGAAAVYCGYKIAEGY